MLENRLRDTNTSLIPYIKNAQAPRLTIAQEVGVGWVVL